MMGNNKQRVTDEAISKPAPISTVTAAEPHTNLESVNLESAPA
jgi:hypothetical protein